MRKQEVINTLQQIFSERATGVIIEDLPEGPIRTAAERILNNKHEASIADYLANTPDYNDSDKTTSAAPRQQRAQRETMRLQK